ncbi:MAG: carbonic anhydrase [Deltaproteobacteria bacterium]
MRRSVTTMNAPPENTNAASREALARLVDGNQRFATRARRVVERADLDAMFARNGAGQEPWAAVLTCADSRLAPELIFDTLLGEIFSVREAGNTAAAKMTLGSLEFASAMLHVPLLLVLGHRTCGAVAAALEGSTAPGHIAILMEAITPGIAGMTDLDAAIEANVRASLATIRKESDALHSAEAAGKLIILGAIYDPATGEVAFLPS